MSAVTRDELMAVAAARHIRDGDVLFVGTGLPMVAGYLAKATHAPNAVLVFESGVVDARPRELATGVGDFRLVGSASYRTGLAETLGMLDAGRVDLGFLGAAEVDRHGNVNSTVIGEYASPAVRLPGSGGANDIASCAKRFVIIARHDRRRFPARLSYVTTPGFLSGGAARGENGLPGGGPAGVVTDLGTFSFDAEGAMQIDTLHPGVTVEQVLAATAFPLGGADREPPQTPLPDAEEIRLLRERIDPAGVYLSRDRR
ncbi:CoA-transferase subunit beta [Conexibacter sp. CPCC 206217]|uniref:CoA-transferase subunit beta n=1 Tax=Conexibacter sp. CPCC 206217 TaxID=3064574 RepID=UPI002716284D|nr:CoA-transferase [Conexibacter sp. CPCC 206217]MDO8211028.1 CoA-transferase [Conexibacter sp. CPCC 206217]